MNLKDICLDIYSIFEKQDWKWDGNKPNSQKDIEEHILYLYRELKKFNTDNENRYWISSGYIRILKDYEDYYVLIDPMCRIDKDDLLIEEL